MNTISGLGKLDRHRLSEIIRGTRGIISVDEAAGILKKSSSETAKLLSRWAKKGWLSRIKRGIYILVPFESKTTEMPLEDPWVIAEKLYSPCYIAGWSAAGYWDLTEQIFRTTTVVTTQRPMNRNPLINGTKFLLRTSSEKTFFGLRPVWRGSIKVMVSDPTRTILDMLNDPESGGGIRPCVDVLLNYLKSEQKDIHLLLSYSNKLGNGAVFKRLGFLLERYAPDEKEAVETCLQSLTKGNSSLDPSQEEEKLVTRWKLWIPGAWVNKEKNN